MKMLSSYSVQFRVLNMIVQSPSSPKSVLICLFSAAQNAYAVELGLLPSNESGGKKKSVRITRAGIYLKPALVQCAHAAVKSDKSPYYKKKYESLVKRRGKKRAIIAIARMLLTAIYQMLSTGEEWNPSDLYKIDMPESFAKRQKDKAIKQAMKLLQKEGLLPLNEPLAS